MVGRGVRPRDRDPYVSSITLPFAATLSKSPIPDIGYVGKMAPVETLQGIPLWKPPYGRITAIDLNTGDHRWMAPVGDLRKKIPCYDSLVSPRSGEPRAVTCS